MKVVFTLASILFVYCQGQSFAQPVSENLAGELATKFLVSRMPENNLLPCSWFENKDIEICRKDTQALFYIINYDQGGFILVSADKRFFPVLAYSFDGKFDQDNIPDNCKSWIDHYKAQIGDALADNGPFFPDMPLRWHQMDDPGFSLKPVNEVLPLIPANWSQTYPYNRKCPADAGGYDGYTPVGCVALAMAQLMYYYRFPAEGQGTENYTPPYHDGIYGEQYVDFSSRVYHWDRMTDTGYNDHDSGAMICYDAGVALHTSYTPTSSGASVNNVPGSLKDHFYYLADDYLARDDVDSTRDWVSRLVDDLNNGQPVIYRSSAGFCGHVYLCDGYQDSTHFHFNWGWGGKYNGYFYIDNLVPGGIDLNLSQGAVFNIYPDTTRFPYPGEISDTVLLSGNSGSFEDGSGPCNYPADLHWSWLIQPDDTAVTNLWLELSMIDTETNVDMVRIFDGNSSDFPLIAELSGNALPFSCKSSGPALFITFDADSQNQGAGFHGSYYGFRFPFCSSALLTDATGVLQDGSGFLDYADNADCEWIIAPYISPLDSVTAVNITFNRLELAAGDTVYIFDGPDKSSPLLGKYTGNVLPVDIASESNAILVNFITDDADSSSGWKITWKFIPPDYCLDTMIYEGPEGVISDGSSDKNYPENADCYYVIDTKDADFIRIDFSEFDLETDYDYLKIIDPALPDFYLYKFSGHNLPSTVSIPLSKVLLWFHSDERDNYQGWKLSYSSYGSGMDDPQDIVMISPNPVRDILQIHFPSTISTGALLKICRLDGSWIYSGNYYSSPLNIDVKSWLPGIYFLLIFKEDQIYSSRIIKL